MIQKLWNARPCASYQKTRRCSSEISALSIPRNSTLLDKWQSLFLLSPRVPGPCTPVLFGGARRGEKVANPAPVDSRACI